jgi:hypothetical protein
VHLQAPHKCWLGDYVPVSVGGSTELNPYSISIDDLWLGLERSRCYPRLSARKSRWPHLAGPSPTTPPASSSLRCRPLHLGTHGLVPRECNGPPLFFHRSEGPLSDRKNELRIVFCGPFVAHFLTNSQEVGATVRVLPWFSAFCVPRWDARDALCGIPPSGPRAHNVHHHPLRPWELPGKSLRLA